MQYLQNRITLGFLIATFAFTSHGMDQASYALTDSSNFDTVINAPPTVIDNLEIIGSDTQLNVSAGGQVGRFVQAGLPSTTPGVSTNVEVNISGGVVGDNFSANENSIVNITGGSIAHSFEAKHGSTVNISGTPTIGSSFTAGSGSDVRIEGGSFSSLTANSGGRMVIDGGEFGRLLIRDQSAVAINGGLFPAGLSAGGSNRVVISGGRFGPSFSATATDNLTRLLGNEFKIDGVPIPDLTSVSLALGESLTGTLRDGSVFAFTSNGSSEGLNNVRLQRVNLPELNLTPIVLTSAADAAPAGLRAGMSVTLQGDSRLGDYYTAVDSQLDVAGGSTGRGLEAFGATINLSDGSIGDNLVVRQGGTLNISGGILGQKANVRNSTVQVSGGLIQSEFFAGDSDVEITGGEFGGLLRVDGPNSRVDISGGTTGRLVFNKETVVNISSGNVGRNLTIASGSVVNISGGQIDGRGTEVFNGSKLNLVVREAFFDDEKVENLSPDFATIIGLRDGTLSGKFSDGSEFQFHLVADRNSRPDNSDTYIADGAELTMTLAIVPEPSSICCFLLGSLGLLSCRRPRCSAQI